MKIDGICGCGKSDKSNDCCKENEEGVTNDLSRFHVLVVENEPEEVRDGKR